VSGEFDIAIWAYFCVDIASLARWFVGLDKGYVELFAAALDMMEIERGEDEGCETMQTSGQES
jgi:hypothetical protein